jgi:hypothetical protein
MEGHHLSIRPSGEFLLSELEYLRELEQDFGPLPTATQSLGTFNITVADRHHTVSATQSLGASDCGPAAPSLSFPSFATTLPPQSVASPPDIPPAAPTAATAATAHIPPEQEEQILKEWEKLQQIRQAAARAAEIARVQATEVARLEAAIATAAAQNPTNPNPNPTNHIGGTANTSNEPINGGLNSQLNPGYVEERIVTWPPNTRCVPPNYDLASHNAPVLQARAQRVAELGGYYFKGPLAAGARDEEEAVAAAAEKVGGYENLAKVLRDRIKQQQ